MPINCLVFDCDGVILESVPVKTKAFARLAEPYGDEARDRFVMYHKVHGGVSRFKKFEWFFENIVGRPITPEESEDWGRRFAEYAYEEVCRCDLVPGIQEVLDTWYGVLPMFVCSGAPHDELNTILEARGLKKYFRGVDGSPTPKSMLLSCIVAESGATADETLFVGDSPTDAQAADIVGTQFYGRGDEVKGGPWPWEPDLVGLNDWIKANR